MGLTHRHTLWYHSCMDTLKQRIAGIGTQAAPSLVPDFNAPIPAKPEEVIPDLSAFVADPAVRLQISRWVAEHAEAGRKEREAKKVKKPLTEKIKKICMDRDIDKTLVGGVRVTLYNAPRTTLSATLLLAAGVSPATIAACMVTKDAWTLKVTPPGVKEEDDE